MSFNQLQSEQGLALENTIFDIFGVQMQFLVTPDQIQQPISLFLGSLPPSIVIPLHSHPEPEIFYVLEGTLEVYCERGPHQGWSTYSRDRVITVTGDVKHALRNTSSVPARTILVTQDQLYNFFRDVAVPMEPHKSGPPSPEQMHKLFSAAGQHNYWMASPEENAAIGISLGS